MFTRTIEFTRANGCKTNVMAVDLKFLLTETLTREIMWRVSLMEEEFTLGQTVKFTMESGDME